MAAKTAKKATTKRGNGARKERADRAAKDIMPTTYLPNVHPDWGRALARNGYMLADIAKAFGISRPTLNKWRKEHPDFDESLQEGRDSVDAKVENALLRRALGYTYTEEKVLASRTVNGVTQPLKVEKITKHQQPDVIACVFWLQNRQPDKWKDRRVTKQTPENSVESGVTQEDAKEFKEFVETNEAARKQIANVFIQQLTAGNDDGGKGGLSPVRDADASRALDTGETS